MITRFSSLYAGHVDLGDMGQDATPANERRYSHEHLNTVFSKTEAVAGRGGWDRHGIPTIDQAMGARSWYCGPAEGMIEYLKELEEAFPGLETVNVQSSMGTPEAVMLEQLERFAAEVMPAFGGSRVA